MAKQPPASWQAKRAALKSERRAYPPVGPGVPCGLCDHSRSSHSMVIMTGRCRVTGCGCDQFEPMCGCGHVLIAHAFDTPPDHWACAICICKGFGAAAPLPQPTLF